MRGTILQVEQGVMVRCSEMSATPQAQAAMSRSLAEQAEEEDESLETCHTLLKPNKLHTMNHHHSRLLSARQHCAKALQTLFQLIQQP